MSKPRKSSAGDPSKPPARLNIEDETSTVKAGSSQPPRKGRSLLDRIGKRHTGQKIPATVLSDDESSISLAKQKSSVSRKTAVLYPKDSEDLLTLSDEQTHRRRYLHQDIERGSVPRQFQDSQHSFRTNNFTPLQKWRGVEKHPLSTSPGQSAIIHGEQGPRKSQWFISYEVTDGLGSSQPSPKRASSDIYGGEEVEEEEEVAKRGVLPALRYGVRKFYFRKQNVFRRIGIVLFAVAFSVYFGFALFLRVREQGRPMKFYYNYCYGAGFLIIIVGVVLLWLFYHIPIRLFYTRLLSKYFYLYIMDLVDCFEDKAVKRILYGMTSLIFIIFLLFDGIKHEYKLRCTAGVFIYVFLGYIFSKHPTHVRWSVVFWGFVVQYTLAMLLLYWGLGELIIRCISNKVSDFVKVSNEGAILVFNYLINGSYQLVNVTSTLNCTHIHNLSCFNLGNESADLISSGQDNYSVVIQGEGWIYSPWIVGFRMIPAILFFSSVCSILCYYGWMQWVVIRIAWVLQVTLGTTAAESINAAATIFLGCTEAPLVIRPFLRNMTKSELHAVLTAGYTTIAGPMFTVYVAFGLDPMDLMTATVMSAPAALAYSKLLYPETEESTTTVKDIKLLKGMSEEHNVFAAATNGTMNALPLVARVIANLITFISLLKLVNLIITWFTSLVGFSHLTLEFMLGKLFIPCAYFMGIDVAHCSTVGELIGIKTIINEFVAFEKLQEYFARGMLTKREKIISTYALCGFSNLSAIGIQLGFLGSLAPSRMDDLASLALRSLVAGSVTCFLTACIAGSLLN